MADGTTFSDEDIFGKNVKKGQSSFSDDELFDTPTQDNALVKGFKNLGSQISYAKDMTNLDYTGAAEGIAQNIEYQRKNPGSEARQGIGKAWRKDDALYGDSSLESAWQGAKNVVGEITGDFSREKTLTGKADSVWENAKALGGAVVEQVPNMLPPMAGMIGGGIAGGAAGSAIPGVGTVAGAGVGAFTGASTGNTLVEGQGTALNALRQAGIDPMDREAVAKYLEENSGELFQDAATKGAIIGAVDTVTAAVSGGMLTAPARAATNRALSYLGVNIADKAAVQAAKNTPEFAAKIAEDAVFQASKSGAGNVSRNIGAAALDPAGEFTGEFVGSGVAQGEWNAKEAMLEAVSSVGQSGAMYAGQKGYQAATKPFEKTETQPADTTAEDRLAAMDAIRKANTPTEELAKLRGNPELQSQFGLQEDDIELLLKERDLASRVDTDFAGANEQIKAGALAAIKAQTEADLLKRFQATVDKSYQDDLMDDMIDSSIDVQDGEDAKLRGRKFDRMRAPMFTGTENPEIVGQDDAEAMRFGREAQQHNQERNQPAVEPSEFDKAYGQYSPELPTQDYEQAAKMRRGDDLIDADIDQSVRLAEGQKRKAEGKTKLLPAGQGFELINENEANFRRAPQQGFEMVSPEESAKRVAADEQAAKQRGQSAVDNFFSGLMRNIEEVKKSGAEPKDQGERLLLGLSPISFQSFEDAVAVPSVDAARRLASRKIEAIEKANFAGYITDEEAAAFEKEVVAQRKGWVAKNKGRTDNGLSQGNIDDRQDSMPDAKQVGDTEDVGDVQGRSAESVGAGRTDNEKTDDKNSGQIAARNGAVPSEADADQRGESPLGKNSSSASIQSDENERLQSDLQSQGIGAEGDARTLRQQREIPANKEKKATDEREADVYVPDQPASTLGDSQQPPRPLKAEPFTTPSGKNLITISGDTFAHEDAIKTIPGARWNKTKKAWTVPAESRDDMERALDGLIENNTPDASTAQQLTAASAPSGVPSDLIPGVTKMVDDQKSPDATATETGAPGSASTLSGVVSTGQNPEQTTPPISQTPTNTGLTEQKDNDKTSDKTQDKSGQDNPVPAQRTPENPVGVATDGERQPFSPATAIKLVADDINQLRPQDVYRVLESVEGENRETLRKFIVKNHGDNQRILDEVRASMRELAGEKNTTPGTDLEHDPNNDFRYFGSDVTVAAKKNHRGYKGTLQRTILTNGGDILGEIKPEGQDTSFRVPMSQVTIDYLRDHGAKDKPAEPAGIDFSKIKARDSIKFKRGNSEYTEMVLKVMPTGHHTLDKTFLVDLFGDKYIKYEEIIAVKHADGTIQKAAEKTDPAPTIADIAATEIDGEQAVFVEDPPKDETPQQEEKRLDNLDDVQEDILVSPDAKAFEENLELYLPKAEKALKDGMAFIRKFVVTVPEFKKAPVFTVVSVKHKAGDHGGMYASGNLLRFTDSYQFDIAPKMFGLRAESLKPGQKIRLDLDKWLGVKSKDAVTYTAMGPLEGAFQQNGIYWTNGHMVAMGDSPPAKVAIPNPLDNGALGKIVHDYRQQFSDTTKNTEIDDPAGYVTYNDNEIWPVVLVGGVELSKKDLDFIIKNTSAKEKTTFTVISPNDPIAIKKDGKIVAILMPMANDNPRVPEGAETGIWKPKSTNKNPAIKDALFGERKGDAPKFSTTPLPPSQQSTIEELTADQLASAKSGEYNETINPLGLKEHNGQIELAVELETELNGEYAVIPWRMPDALVRKDSKGRVNMAGSAKSDFELAERIAKIFGKKIIWATIGEQFSINGLVLRKGLLSDYVFIDPRSARPAHVIYGHELSHFLETEHPADYKALFDIVEPMMKNIARYKKTQMVGMDNLELKKELLGDLMGDAFGDPSFWSEVAAQSPSKFRNIAKKIRNWINDIIARLIQRGYGSSQYVSDLKATRKALAQIIAKTTTEKGANDLVAMADFAQPAMMSIKEAARKIQGMEAFKKWFGGSKVVDERGEPLVVYHGAPDARFVKEDGIFKGISERYGSGKVDGVHWFASSKRTASTYADDHRAFDYQNAVPEIIPAYLQMTNPLIIDAQGKEWREAQARGKTSDVIEQAKNDGHDGVLIRNVKDDYNNNKRTSNTDTYAVFSSNQIKHILNTTWDGTNPNIMKSFGGARANTTNLDTAQSMEAQGKTPREIWNKTGWWKLGKGSSKEAYPKSGSVVDGLDVGEDVKNTDSIDATLGEEDYTVLAGIRTVQMSEFNSDPHDLFYAKDDIDRARRIAAAIKESGRIDPLIVVIEEQGPYILEGGHRLAALNILGKKEFPALVVYGEGTEPNTESQWKYEIDDSLSTIRTGKDGLLSEVLKHPALFKDYPQIEKIRVRFADLGDTKRGSYDADKRILAINQNFPTATQRSTIQHEVQHIIQGEEGFAGGGNLATQGADKYWRQTGEIEARLVQARLDMPPARRKIVPPWVTLKRMLRKEGLLKNGMTVDDVMKDRGQAIAFEPNQLKSATKNTGAYSRDNGDISAGILMPAGFDPQARLNATPVSFATSDQLLAFAKTADPAIIKLRQPGDLRIVKHKGNYRISTHKAVSKAGRFFRDDRALLEITGQFISIGNNMATGTLTESQVVRVFDLFRSRGNTWFTDTYLDEARAAVQGTVNLSPTADQTAEEKERGPAPARASIPPLAVLGDRTDARAKKDIAKLDDAVNKHRRGRSLDFVAVDVAGSVTKRASRVAEMFGKRVVFFRGASPKQDPGGVAIRTAGDVIFVNVASGYHDLNVIGHELLHHMKNEQPDIYGRMKAALLILLKESAVGDYAARLQRIYDNSGAGKRVDNELAVEELIADFIGDRFTDKAFWNELAAAEPTLFRRFADAVIRFIDALLAKFKRMPNFETDKLFIDLQAARKVASESMAEYARRENAGTLFKPVTAAELASPAFKEWFGESKVKGTDGQPAKVFHGSPNIFYTFDNNKARSNTSSPMAGLGHYFALDPTVAAGYTKGTGNVKSFYMRVENPYITSGAKLGAQTMNVESVNRLKERLMREGYDGIFIKDERFVIAFDGRQVKSAEQNTGEFSRENADVRYSFAQSVTMGLKTAARKIQGLEVFKKWFGDSVVVDYNEDPLITYHYTDRTSPFSGNRPIFVAVKKEHAAAYGEKDFPVYVSIKNPFKYPLDAKEPISLEDFKTQLIEASDESTAEDILGITPEYGEDEEFYPWEILETEEAKDIFLTHGFDGYDHLENGDQVYAAFSPAQIKSIFNRGTWDGTNNDIMLSPTADQAASTQPLPSKLSDLSPELQAIAEEIKSRMAAKKVRQPKAGKDRIFVPKNKGKEVLAKSMTGAGNISAAKVIKRFQGYEEMVAALKNNKTDILEKQRLLSAYIKKFSDKVRGTYGLEAVPARITAAGTDKRRLQILRDALRKIDNAHEQYTKRSLLKEIAALIEKNKPKLKGKIASQTKGGYSLYRELKAIKETLTMTEEEVDKRMADLLRISESEDFSFEEVLELRRLAAYGRLDKASSVEAAQALEQLKSTIAMGNSAWAAEMDALKKRRSADRSEMIRVITGGRERKTETEKQKDLKDMSKLSRKLSDMAKAFDDKHQSFEWLLDKLSRLDKFSGLLDSPLVKKFAPLAQSATTEEQTGISAHMALLNEKMIEIFGVEGRALEKKLNENSTVVVSTGVFRRENGLRKEQIPLSQNQAYKRWMEWQDPTLQEQLIEQGYNDRTMEEIEKFMTDEVMEWAEWQLQEFYPQYYGGVNNVFKKLFYTDMPHNPLYSPIKRTYSKGGEDSRLLTQTSHYSAVVNGSLRNRVDNSRFIELQDGDATLAIHIAQMEHFKAWAEPMREMRATLGSESVRIAIRDFHGPAALKTLSGFLDDFAKGKSSEILDAPLVQKFRANFTTAVIGMNPVVFLKQLTSIPAYAAEMPVGQWVKNLPATPSAWITAFKTLGESEVLKARYGVGFERDMIAAMVSKVPGKMAGTKKIANKLMILTMLGDKIAIMGGGWPVYKYTYEQALKAGKTEDQARAEAMENFEAATERTQQAGNIKDLGVYQRGGEIARLFTMFMTAPNAYYRQMSGATRELSKSFALSKEANVKGLDQVTMEQMRTEAAKQRRDALKRLFIVGVVLPVFFQFVASGFDWDDDEMLRSIVLGPMNGLFMFRDISTGLYDYATGNTVFDSPGTPPPLTTMDEVRKTFAAFSRWKADDWVIDKDFWKMVVTGGTVAGQLSGLPIGPAVRVATGIKDTVDEATVNPFLRVLGYSERTLDKANKEYLSLRGDIKSDNKETSLVYRAMMNHEKERAKLRKALKTLQESDAEHGKIVAMRRRIQEKNQAFVEKWSAHI